MHCLLFVCFIWVPGHVGIGGNLAADSAAKDALVGDTSVELIPFSDLKSRANKYILELWQSEWDESLGKKLHKIFPRLKQCHLSSDKQKRRNCDSPIARWPFFYYSFLFVEGWGTANVYQMWWTFNYWTYFACLFRSYWNQREPLYSSTTACVVQEISTERIFNFLREINIFRNDLVPKGVHENRTKGVENKVDDTLKLVVFLECAQC